MFYEFSIDDHVPQDHLLRSIDRFVELSGIRQHLAPFFSNTGRPSIDPELLIRMLLVGYCLGIRSERRLCEEVHQNLAYRWICRLDLSDQVPDHSTFSKNRHGRFQDSDLLRQLFETTVARCIAEGLVSGQCLAIGLYASNVFLAIFIEVVFIVAALWFYSSREAAAGAKPTSASAMTLASKGGNA